MGFWVESLEVTTSVIASMSASCRRRSLRSRPDTKDMEHAQPEEEQDKEIRGNQDILTELQENAGRQHLQQPSCLTAVRAGLCRSC